MTPAVEPVPLRLPKDLLVLQSMQGHLDLEPVLLVAGLRCAIGSAESCAVRLTKSDIVQPEHCVIEVDDRQTTLTEWTPDTTWLNDRLIVEPCELIPGDRVSLGPFDFRLRLASPDELLYVKLVEQDVAETNRAEDALRLKRAINQPSQHGQADVNLFRDLIDETGSSTDSESHERLTQHVSQLLAELQSQVIELQEREANLSQQLRRQHESTTLTSNLRISSLPATLPTSIQSECERVLQLLQSERDQIDRERAEFATEQARWQEEQLEWAQRLEGLETQLMELEERRIALSEEKEICHALAEELLRDKARMEDWEARLRQEERGLSVQRDELELRGRAAAEGDIASIGSATVPLRPIEMASPIPRMESVEGRHPDPRRGELDSTPIANRSPQTFLTLIAFGASAFFLGADLGHSEVTAAIGWTTALVAAISTLNLLLHRCFTTVR